MIKAMAKHKGVSSYTNNLSLDKKYKLEPHHVSSLSRELKNNLRIFQEPCLRPGLARWQEVNSMCVSPSEETLAITTDQGRRYAFNHALCDVKTLLKSKTGRGERGTQLSRPSPHRADKLKCENGNRRRPLSSAKAPWNTNGELASEDNLKHSKRKFAGAKFCESPPPSAVPMPPSHWVRENCSKHSDISLEQMSVHLKTILRIQSKP